MTEKRFWILNVLTENSGIKDGDKLLSFDEVVYLLNQLDEDNNALIKIIENQSYIIQQLHTKLIEYELKEPIKLTVEDIELMGKAISYYTHGRYAE